MDVFDPVRYSLEENKFFLQHLGESPVVALQDTLPKGVNPVTVREVLGALYELDELQKHRGNTWVGQEAISTSINTYLTEWQKWKELSDRGAPRFPTMHAWDGKGRPHRGGVGSDASQVTTYLMKNGERGTLAVPLQHGTAEAFVADWVQTEDPLPDALVHDAEKGFLQCPLDSWSTNYNPESRQAYNMARARMSRHCKSSKDDRVREFGQKIFG
tara:strand:- start:260 stop:904 length:645 start_codon:yes stop_codon:yes gene_type:complete